LIFAEEGEGEIIFGFYSGKGESFWHAHKGCLGGADTAERLRIGSADSHTPELTLFLNRPIYMVGLFHALLYCCGPDYLLHRLGKL
tara:strand:- start:583 stop:840 length:258 start_codon:yes stop_codon:yes gene_type:complete